MSVVDRKVIDFGHEDDDKVTICISDHIPWKPDEIKAHIEVLQDKINDYLEFIESGQIYEDFGGKGKTPNIKVIFCHEPVQEVLEYLNKIKSIVVDRGYFFEWIYRPLDQKQNVNQIN
ncbi:MAG: hypothetical protein K6B70_02590 [Clostridia bacterium]|nr:hypothetical protein [Clostridia bacterium]